MKKALKIILMIVFFPITLIYLLWKKTNFNKVVKTAGTVLILLIMIAAFGSDKSAPEQSSDEVLLEPTMDAFKSPETSTVSKEPETTALTQTKPETTVSSDKKAETKAPETTEPKKPAPETSAATTAPSTSAQQSSVISLIKITSPVNTNETATVSVKGKPKTEYAISVYYSSGASKAAGLDKKMSDSQGNVSWSWKIGGNTKPGDYSLTIRGGGQELKVPFTVR